jgi:hypothetical protein
MAAGLIVHGVNEAGRTDAFRGANREPTRTGSYIRDRRTGLNLENIHNTVNVEFLFAVPSFEDGKIAGVRFARLPRYLRLERRLQSYGLCTGRSDLCTASQQAEEDKKQTDVPGATQERRECPEPKTPTELL